MDKLIPKNWHIKNLGDVADIKNGKNQKAVVNPKGIYPIYGSAGEMGFADDFLCEAGTTIVGRKGTINKPIYVSTKFWNVDTAFGFSPKINLIESKFLFFFCQSFNFHKLDKSTTIPSLAKTDLLKIEIPIPPLSEQQAIVSKIEELLSDLENGKQQLQIAQQQLKIYRQSLLKWAFGGKLTNKNVKDGELPKGWRVEKLGNVLKTIDGDRGPNYPKKKDFFEKEYCLFLSTKNVREDRFLFKEKMFITKEKDEQLRGGKLNLNDVVITTRGTLGNVALYNENILFKNIRINSGMLILRIIKEDLNNYFLMKFITSPNFISQLKEKQSGTAQPQIPANILREIEIPIPPTTKEQQLIVDELESKLTVCDKMEETISQSLLHAESLRQSILKKAFEGKLV